MQHTAIGSDAQKQKIQPKFPSRSQWTKFDLEKIKAILGKTSGEAWRKHSEKKQYNCTDGTFNEAKRQYEAKNRSNQKAFQMTTPGFYNGDNGNSSMC